MLHVIFYFRLTSEKATRDTSSSSPVPLVHWDYCCPACMDLLHSLRAENAKLKFDLEKSEDALRPEYKAAGGHP